jgi:ferredoxin
MAQEKMPEQTLKALKNSIAKWQVNSTVTRTRDAKIYTNTCALCDLFFDERIGTCSKDCPVKAYTGFDMCEGSPWHLAHREYPKGRVSTFRAAAVKMTDFLIVLLPESEAP